MIFNDIIENKRNEVRLSKQARSCETIQDYLSQNPPMRRQFRKTLTAGNDIKIIAELKKASPSHGVIRDDFNILQLAEEYELGGAVALSVLTETTYFQGRLSYLKTVRRVTSLPILRKDFIVDAYQIYESAMFEADAVLLITSLFTEEELKQLIDLCRNLSLDPLVEVHSKLDLSKALNAGADLVGINNRNLSTLEVDPQAAEKLLPIIPKNICVIVESGLSTHEELQKYLSLGANKFLIGTTLMKAKCVASKLRELRGVVK